jgi:hypothetical protein
VREKGRGVRPAGQPSWGIHFLAWFAAASRCSAYISMYVHVYVYVYVYNNIGLATSRSDSRRPPSGSPLKSAFKQTLNWRQKRSMGIGSGSNSN